MSARTAIFRAADFINKAMPYVRAIFIRTISGLPVKRVGRNLKLRGVEKLQIGPRLAVGDACWIEAVTKYAGITHSPILSIGSDVSLSDWVHISCACKVYIGNGCLLGSKIYIGDHTHGDTYYNELTHHMPPAKRPLTQLDPIYVGDNCWIGDGAIILGGTRLAAGSIVGANSVVHLDIDRAAVVAGVPARILRYLDGQGGRDDLV
jgi:acetyltransferase-like isoleucine patch superfamily enzyme